MRETLLIWHVLIIAPQLLYCLSRLREQLLLLHHIQWILLSSTNICSCDVCVCVCVCVCLFDKCGTYVCSNETLYIILCSVPIIDV